MATISDIVYKGKGTAGHWHVERDEPADPYCGYVVCSLYHYSTLMLTWQRWSNGWTPVCFTGLGHGSVSDQGGMNTAFKVLGAPYYYSRKGGADIIDR